MCHILISALIPSYSFLKVLSIQSFSLKIPTRLLRETWDILQLYSFDQSFEKEGRSHIELSFIVLLTALEMAHGETFRWHAGSANRLECTKKRISLQNTRLLLYFRVLARNVLPHCAHDTKLHNIRKSIPN